MALLANLQPEMPARRHCCAGAMYEEVEIEEGAVSKLQSGMARKWQHMLDMSAPHTAARWGISALVMITYAIRIYLINGAMRSQAAAEHSGSDRLPGARERRAVAPAAPPQRASGGMPSRPEHATFSRRRRRVSPRAHGCACGPVDRLVHHHLRAGHLRAEPVDRVPVAPGRPRERGEHAADVEGPPSQPRGRQNPGGGGGRGTMRGLGAPQRYCIPGSWGASGTERMASRR